MVQGVPGGVCGHIQPVLLRYEMPAEEVQNMSELSRKKTAYWWLNCRLGRHVKKFPCMTDKSENRLLCLHECKKKWKQWKWKYKELKR